ncbi:MAG: sensor domain-containing diguanylate cyclase [Firmicutes bacterium]|nr:sensor domain-containing diguanylate cyclase [Bacillota bacterium]
MGIIESDQREIIRLRALNQLLCATREALDTRTILAAVRDHIHPLIEFHRLGLLVADMHDKYCIIEELVTKESLVCCPPGSIMSIADTAIEWVYRERRTQYNPDLRATQEFIEDATLLQDGIVTIARVPLRAFGKIYGVMTVKSTIANAFSMSDLELLDDVSNHIGGALYAAKLIMELRLRSYTDALTGVYNRRALHALTDAQSLIHFLDEFMIEGEWSEIDTLSVLVFDLDDFKLYNDTYGHVEGDERLRTFAQLLRYAAPAHQLIFRYGGDEFILLLPNATSMEAHRIASHVRQSALKAGDHKRLPLSVSIGVYQDVWTDLSALIRAADAAMYEDKRRRPEAEKEVGLS